MWVVTATFSDVQYPYVICLFCSLTGCDWIGMWCVFVSIVTIRIKGMCFLHVWSIGICLLGKKDIPEAVHAVEDASTLMVLMVFVDDSHDADDVYNPIPWWIFRMCMWVKMSCVVKKKYVLWIRLKLMCGNNKGSGWVNRPARKISMMVTILSLFQLYHHSVTIT